MRNLRGTYVHRGDLERRRIRIRRALLSGAVCFVAVLAVKSREPAVANAEPSSFAFGIGDGPRLRDELEAARGELSLANAQLERTQKVFAYSSKYRIGADLAGSIMDASMAEGIEPDLAFRVVKIESEFNDRATSPVGAIGLTQLMLPTARYFEKGITRAALYDRETNLRVGFRYLRTLIKQYKGDVNLALLVYNRGPVAVEAARGRGDDPSNGYEHAVMKGYRGKGTVE